MRVAIVHDWIYTLGGAEKVLASILRCFPGSELYCLFDVLPAEDRARIGYEISHTSFLQTMPAIARRHRLYLPLMPLAVEQFDLSSYDLIISSSYAVAKGVLTGPDQLHVAYVHSPMRYAWDLQHQYLSESRLDRGVKSWLARILLHRMRLWDIRSSHGVDSWIANSHFISRRIRKLYGQQATVISPPVEVPDNPVVVERADYFLTASRLVPYKNVRAIVEAFALLPELKLVVAGEGPERSRLQEIATSNVTFTGFVSDQELQRRMSEARAFVFAAEEDFGIVPVEAQGRGTPVIALGRGGARETVLVSGPAPTGLFFDRPEAGLIAAAIRSFLSCESAFTVSACHANAKRFSQQRFETDFRNFVFEQYETFKTVRRVGQERPFAVPVMS